MFADSYLQAAPTALFDHYLSENCYKQVAPMELA
jgi:hypothetical protein